MKKIALYGPRGAGKSTTGNVLKELLGDRCIVLHSAEPLYDMQQRMYRFANRQLDVGQQDGTLLAALAALLRGINGAALAENITRRVEDIRRDNPLVEWIVCDDSVLIDREHLAATGFKFVYVSAPHDLRLLRRSERGDIATQADTNDPDVKAFSEEDPVIINTSDISELKSQVMSLIACSTS